MLDSFSDKMAGEKMRFQEKTTGSPINDQDVADWMASLREGGFTDEEIDRILVRANETYRALKGKDVVEKELALLENDFIRKQKRPFAAGEREYFRKGLERAFFMNKKP